MGIETHKTEAHWNYMLAIERDVDELSRYVEFDERNFECFSIEIARILLTASAEVDVVCKQICKMLNSNSAAKSINSYRTEIVPKYPEIPHFEIEMPRFGLMLRPWDEWKEEKRVPFWWTAYNKIKHQRDTAFDRANLKNALNAVSALFVMVLYLYKEKAESGDLRPSPMLVKATNEHIHMFVISGGESRVRYRL